MKRQRLNPDDRDMLVGVIVLVLLVVALLGAIQWWKRYTCKARWQDSGMKSEYRFATGCMVQRKDGTWLPQLTIREVGQ